MRIHLKERAPSTLLKRLFMMTICTGVFFLLITAILYRTESIKHGAHSSHADKKTAVHEIPFVLVMCKGGTLPPELANTTSEELQLRKATVLIKSAAALTSERISFIILCDYYSTFESIVNEVNKWPSEYQKLITLQYRPIYTPPIDNVLSVYAPCAMESIFLPWALPELDVVVYLDTDTFFLRPPQDLLVMFKDFNSNQVLGVAPVDGYYLQPNILIPYYGAKGMSSGILLANLTRWRQMPFSWLTTVEAVLADYGNRLTTGDQDVFNIIFSEYPDYIYEIGCEWAGLIEQCKSWNWACDDIEKRGFSMVHGARWRFFIHAEPGAPDVYTPMRVMFRAWERHRLGAPVSGLLKVILQELIDLEEEGLKESQNPSSSNIEEEGLNASQNSSPNNIEDGVLVASQTPSSNNSQKHYFCNYDIRKLFIPLAQFVARTEAAQWQET